MMQFSELLKFESQNDVWSLRYFDYPVWTQVRHTLIKDGVSTPAPLRHSIKLKRIILSVWHVLKLYWLLEEKEKIYFISNRAVLMAYLEHYRNECDAIFVFEEMGSLENCSIEFAHYCSEFLQGLRFICRKIAPFAGWSFINKVQNKFPMLFHLPSFKEHITNAVGDGLFYQFLKFFFKGWGGQIYYALGVIPPGAKLLSDLNLFELQHGLIYDQHMGYSGIPNIKSTLIVYKQKYCTVLERMGYSGKFRLDELPRSDFAVSQLYKYDKVIFTQPTEKFQLHIQSYLQNNPKADIYLQIHPRDGFAYSIAECRLVNDASSCNTRLPICYFSTVIEAFCDLDHPRVVVYNAGDISNAILESCLDVMSLNSKTELVRITSLDEIGLL